MHLPAVCHVYVCISLQFPRSSLSQEVVGWGWFAWKGAKAGGTTLDFLSDIGGVQQLVCAEKAMVVLTDTGKVYLVSYASEAAVS